MSDLSDLSDLLWENTTTNVRTCGCPRLKFEALVERVLADPDNVGWLLHEEYVTYLSAPNCDPVVILEEIEQAAHKVLQDQCKA
jgi:hypothetical protein